MTSPIQFPSISPPQLAPQKESSLHGLAELTLAIVHGRQQLAIRRQQLEQEKLRTAAQLATDTQERAGAAADLRKKLKDIELQQQRVDAGEIASRHVQAILGAPGGITPSVYAETRQRAMSENNKLAPYIAEAFDAQLGNAQQALATSAQRRAEEVRARVGEHTEAAQTATALAQPTLVRLQIKNEQLMARLRQDELELDPARRAQFTAILQGGGTAGDAYRIIGRTRPADVPENYRLPGARQAAGGGAAAQQTQSISDQMALGNSLIDAANEGGRVPITIRGTLVRSGNPFAVMALNPHLAPRERQIIQGYQLLAQAYALHVTGTTASNTQMQLFQNTVVDQRGDDEATYKQKRAVRHALVLLVQSGAKPTEVTAGLLDAATRAGMPTNVLSIIRAQAALAKKYEASPQYRQQQGLSLTPGDATNLDPALASRLSGRP